MSRVASSFINSLWQKMARKRQWHLYVDSALIQRVESEAELRGVRVSALVESELKAKGYGHWVDLL